MAASAIGGRARFRRDIRLMADALDTEPAVVTAQVLDALARMAGVTNRELGEYDWFRLLDAMMLVAAHPERGR
jgi:hypothetical protein